MADDITMSSAAARAHWGDVMMLAWKDGKHVHVTLNGKNRVVIVSEEEWSAKQESER